MTASVDIATAPDQVWRVLTRFEDYGVWNPFITAIEGEARVGASIVVTFKLPQKADVSLDATIANVDENAELQWRTTMLEPGVFEGAHRITIESNATGCIVHQTLSYNGSPDSPAAALTSEIVEHGLHAMNDALKRKVETVGTN